MSRSEKMIGNKNGLGNKSGEGKRRDKTNRWKGGRTIDRKGYVLIYCPDHPHARGNYVLEHRLVMEAHLGRTLLPSEVVHHIDGDKTNNIIPNLQLYSSSSGHSKYHRPKGIAWERK